MQKKGFSLTLETIVVAILVLIFLFVMVQLWLGSLRKTEPYYTGTIEGLADESCKARGDQMRLKDALPKENDVDEDGRPDFVCDVCVCAENKCPNQISSNNDVDKNGNHIPDGCEDLVDKDDPWETGCKRESRKNAFDAKGDTGHVIVLDKKNYLWQCRLGFAKA